MVEYPDDFVEVRVMLTRREYDELRWETAVGEVYTVAGVLRRRAGFPAHAYGIKAAILRHRAKRGDNT